jgi:glycosyltransferase involved in cell wall biosynthesis
VREVNALSGRHVVFLSWRDTRNPEGGGAERYLDKMAQGLVEHGCRVTISCAAHPAAPAEETVDGVRYVRRGSKMSVYPQGMWSLLRRRFGKVDLVVDVQNGLPFFSRLVTRKPVVVLVHHVHREQWPVVYPGLTGRVGWWIEHRLAPWLYRREQYVAVSQATRSELHELGVRGPRIAVVHNGTDQPLLVGNGPEDLPGHHKASAPTVCTVGRLVPHKQVEHAIDAVLDLRQEMPDLTLHVVGTGWWEEALHAYAATQGAGEVVVFDGLVDEERKHAIYEASWALALPSLKEGWGLVVGEAGMHGTPTVAYRSAGGTRESVVHDYSGLLVDTQDDFTAALRDVLTDGALRGRLSAGAQEVSRQFTWEHAQESFALVLESTLKGSRLDSQDPEDLGAGTHAGPASDHSVAVAP